MCEHNEMLLATKGITGTTPCHSCYQCHSFFLVTAVTNINFNVISMQHDFAAKNDGQNSSEQDCVQILHAKPIQASVTSVTANKYTLPPASTMQRKNHLVVQTLITVNIYQQICNHLNSLPRLNIFK